MNVTNRTSLVINKKVTNRTNKSIDSYLTEINRINRISPEEEVELCEKIKQGDLEARNALVKANLRFAVSIAKMYCPEKSDLSDYVNVANIGLIKAAEKFDSTQGFKFITFAVWWVRAALVQYLNDDKIIRIPSNQKKRINENIKQFEKEYSDICEFDVTLFDQVRTVDNGKDNLYAVNAHNVVSGSSKIHSDSSEIELFDAISSEDYADDTLVIADDKKAIHKKIDAVLSPRLATIIKMSYGIGYDREYSLDEIANLFSLSRERIRQQKESALRKLRKHIKPDQLCHYQQTNKSSQKK